MLLTLLALPAFAQPSASLPDRAPVPPPGVPQVSAEARVSLLTFYPREQVHTVFGHSAFRVADPATGLDRVYNFGTFDFDQPFFLLRFIRGQLDYRLSVADTDRVLAFYRSQGRATVEQTLALDSTAVRTMFALLETNYLPENRTYRYDFFFDNCATRLVDAVDASTPDTLRLGTFDDDATFRALLQPYLAEQGLLRLGINLGLGLPTDAVATDYQRTFLPLELLDAFDRATLGGRPLVARTDTLYWTSHAGRTRTTSSWPLVLTWGLFVLGGTLTVLGWRRTQAVGVWSRRGDALLFLVAGFAGAILAFLWFATEHRVTGPNLSLLWLWPTHALVAGLLLRTALPGWGRAYLWAAAIAAGSMALTWGLWPETFPTPLWPVAALLALRAARRALEPQLEGEQAAQAT
ncbi:MAG: DUF4105 domain-containing protein [Bacteroidota bacterium]